MQIFKISLRIRHPAKEKNYINFHFNYFRSQVLNFSSLSKF